MIIFTSEWLLLILDMHWRKKTRFFQAKSLDIVEQSSSFYYEQSIYLYFSRDDDLQTTVHTHALCVDSYAKMPILMQMYKRCACEITI